jgi:hypothetical protein
MVQAMERNIMELDDTNVSNWRMLQWILCLSQSKLRSHLYLLTGVAWSSQDLKGLSARVDNVEQSKGEMEHKKLDCYLAKGPY